MLFDFGDIQPRDASLDTSLEVTQELREFTRLVTLDGSRLETEGGINAAWQWYLAMFRSSRHSGKRGFAIERLAGITIHGMAVRSIERWSRDPLVDAGMLRQALEQLQTDFRMTPPFSTALKLDYLALKNTLNQANLYDYSAEFGVRANSPLKNAV